ncbi:sodium-independent anion transporter [Alcanivorax sp. HI0033]|jgi:SulP family sulfate permease|uniref:SulP family inorganic anion transporter n=1 Tax=unclassified Alcanivorax TaxID=2638842 RepID=UPI0007B82C8A|nr:MULTISPECIES: sulfate permease [unclassified Alcanivorax]KZX77923.1 sodium-independent anion transporter [Alcanivorax sp. HI0011]KZX89573.1 sodium-independent anion transporter [Alcanivorax sp. HI0013]KZY09563.1 sodium-independent anion transporter [Alcanivorax sp. HI0035]KZX61653.1 sodium-independent anion transporter [Alcanivorax sp. HI0003]KZX71941.1 sodium-independent anion transporter [Alcanivorax sp. HI0007]
MKLPTWLGAAQWLPHYNRETAARDSVAAVIVTIMLIPQSLAYAMLAGLPPEVGLYASILPLVVYALLGSSRTLAVGPVAVASLMTVAAASQVATAGSQQYLAATVILAFLSGTILMVMALLRLGWIANLLSHPVVSGFISASGLLIAASQLKHLLGIPLSGHNLVELGRSLTQHFPQTHWPTVVLGALVTAFLFWVRKALKPLLQKLGFNAFWSDLVSKAGPVIAVLGSTLAVAMLELDSGGMAIVGHIPEGLPALSLPVFDAGLWQALLLPALLISLIGFVESISVAQTLAAKRRQRINANQELMGLGGANLASAFSGGFPVTGGFSRSVVNFDAGARTPMAGVFTAIGIALTALFLTGAFTYLPKATLAATIVVAVLSLVDLPALKHTWHFSRLDFTAMAITMVGVLGWGVEAGVLAGVITSLALYLWRTNQPHVAEVGLVPGTEHFRNVQRHQVRVSPRVMSVRIDESLYFANARGLEDRLYDAALLRPQTEHVILMGTAINHLDASAVDSLLSLNQRLDDAGIRLHLSEIKGPVMDQLQHTTLPVLLTGQIFLTQYQAIRALAPESIEENPAPPCSPV